MNDSAVSNGRRFEVLNFGVVGYSTRDEAIALKQKTIPFHPQGVIIGYVLNDPETDPRPSLHKWTTFAAIPRGSRPVPNG